MAAATITSCASCADGKCGWTHKSKATRHRGADGVLVLEIRHDQQFSRTLEDNMVIGASILIEDVKLPDTAANRALIARRLCSMLRYVTEGSQQRMLELTAALQMVFAATVLKPEFYICRSIQDGQASEDACLSAIYMALRLFTSHLFTLGTLYKAGPWGPNKPAALDEDRVLTSTRQFWKALWDARTRLFQTKRLVRYVRMAHEELTITVATAMADCLLQIDVLWEILTKNNAGDRWSISAHLLTWIYIAEDPPLRELVFQKLYNNMLGLSHTPNGHLPAWFFESMPDPQRKRDCVAAFRKCLLSRKGDEGMHSALLDIFDLLQNSHMADGLEPWRGLWDNPVLWCMKAIQRQFCMYPGSRWESHIVPMAFHSMSHWCTGDRKMMHIVHHGVGIPFLPYLGRLALMVFESHPKAEFAHEVFATVAPACSSWASNVKPQLDSEPFIRSAASRRAWIITLQKMRRFSSNLRYNHVIGLWMRLGAACGFDERAEATWLAEGGNGAPSPPGPDTPPWSFCAWSGCMCYEHKPLYKLSACRGCQRAFYCGRACQRKHWKEGHKQTCARAHQK